MRPDYPATIRRTLAWSFCALASLATTSVKATSLTAEQILQQFNQVIFTNLTASADTEGRAYIGGNVTGGNFVSRTLPDSQYAGVTVLGNATNVLSGGGAYVAGNFSGTINNGGAVILGNATNSNFNGSTPTYVAGTSTGDNFNSGKVSTISSNATLSKYASAAESTDFRTVMTNESTGLAALTTNSWASLANGTLTFNATPVNGVAVFNIDSFAGVSQFQFNLGSATSVVINSSLSAGTFNINFLAGSAQSLASKLLWNFYDAVSLTFNTQWGGSILATKAAVTNNNSIEGTLVANSQTQNGEMHQNLLTTVTPVPEPSTYAMMLAGLLVVTGLGRCQQSRRYAA
jgi:choice-of-anchor A domain-containing protein